MPSSTIQGTGTTISFAFAAPNQLMSFSARYRQIGGISRSVDVLDDTALSSTFYREKIAGDLADVAPIPCEIYGNHDVQTPVGYKALVTIRFQPMTGQTNGATLTFSGFISEDDTGALEANTSNMGTFSIQPDGKATKPTWTPGS